MACTREENKMTGQTKLGGTFTLSGTSTSLYRMGYGAMQLAGPEVWGPPRDVDAAIAVLRGGRRWREPYRHQRLLRPACDQSNYQKGPSSLSGRPGNRNQSGRPARCRQIVDSSPFA